MNLYKAHFENIYEILITKQNNFITPFSLKDTFCSHVAEPKASDQITKHFISFAILPP